MRDICGQCKNSRYGQPSVDQICSRQICQDPAKLERLIKMINKEQWSTLPADVKGDIYEGLLEADPACGTGGFLLAAHDDMVI